MEETSALVFSTTSSASTRTTRSDKRRRRNWNSAYSIIGGSNEDEGQQQYTPPSTTVPRFQSSIQDFFSQTAPRFFAIQNVTATSSACGTSNGSDSKRKSSKHNDNDYYHYDSKRNFKDILNGSSSSRAFSPATEPNAVSPIVHQEGEDEKGTAHISLSRKPATTNLEYYRHHEHKSNQNSKKIKKTNTKMRQLFLDVGQKNFAKQMVCSICGMLYIHGVAEDVHEHERICKHYRDGVAFQINPQSCRIVAKFCATRSKHKHSSLTNHHFLSPHKNESSSSINNHSRTTEDGYIIEIRHSDSYALRQKVGHVMEIVDKELGFAPVPMPSSSATMMRENSTSSSSKSVAIPRTVFLYIQEKKVIGLVAAEIIQQAHRLMIIADSSGCNYGEDFADEQQRRNQTQQQQPQPHPQQSSHHYYYERSKESHRAMIGIQKLWVHSKSRKKRLATRLLDTVRARMVYGTLVPTTLVAFSSPTEAGARFAKRYVEQQRQKHQNPNKITACVAISNSKVGQEACNDDKEALVLVYDLPVL